MLNWLTAHWGDLFVGLILIIIVLSIILNRIKKHKEGGCSGCACSKDCSSYCQCQNDLSLKELQDLLEKQKPEHH